MANHKTSTELRPVLKSAIRNACKRFLRDVGSIPLEHWNESVFRFYLVREIVELKQKIDCRTEWNRVDLLVPAADGAMVIEMKFFQAMPLRDSHGGFIRLKGTASPQNYREYEDVVDKLHSARGSRWVDAAGGVSCGFLILAYVDYLGDRRPNRSYKESYGDIELKAPIIDILQVVEDAHVEEGFEFSCKLLEVEVAVAT